MNYFITAIDTDSGKTLVASILCEALGADYWKPVQCGMPRDTETASTLVTNEHCVFHKEMYLLKTPASPHAAASRDGIRISLDDFQVPVTKNDLIIEGAGGCLVPLNDKDFVIDMVARFNSTIILVADLYLGSINHTLLTVEAIRQRKLPLKGIIFNGTSNPDSEEIIQRHTAIPCLLHIHREVELTKKTIKRYALELKKNWYA